MSILKNAILLSIILSGAHALADNCALEVAELTRQEQSYAAECATFEEGKLQAACLMNLEAMTEFREQKAAACIAASTPKTDGAK